MLQINLNQILSFAAQREVSDIHFQVGIPPMVRHMGQLYLLKYPAGFDRSGYPLYRANAGQV